jgi:hypothetical protein
MVRLSVNAVQLSDEPRQEMRSDSAKALIMRLNLLLYEDL